MKPSKPISVPYVVSALCLVLSILACSPYIPKGDDGGLPDAGMDAGI